MRRAALAILALLVILSGCGGSSKSAETTFRVRVDAICASEVSRANALLALGRPVRVQQFAAMIGEADRKLHVVRPPEKSAAAYGRFLEFVDNEAVLVKQLAGYVKMHNAAGVHATISKLNRNVTNTRAVALGLKTCARTVTTVRE
jgi:hypothetical protein